MPPGAVRGRHQSGALNRVLAADVDLDHDAGWWPARWPDLAPHRRLRRTPLLGLETSLPADDPPTRAAPSAREVRPALLFGVPVGEAVDHALVAVEPHL